MADRIFADMDLMGIGIDPANFETRSPVELDFYGKNKEIDLDVFDNKMELILKLSSEAFFSKKISVVK